MSASSSSQSETSGSTSSSPSGAAQATHPTSGSQSPGLSGSWSGSQSGWRAVQRYRPGRSSSIGRTVAPCDNPGMAEPPAPTERRSRTPLPPPPKQGNRGSRLPRTSRSGMRFLGIVVLLLTINWITVSLFALGREESITVPFSPVFEQQVTANNVDRVSTQGEAIDGHFKKPVTYPPKGQKNSESASNFETQIPTFAANTDTVFSLLKEHNVTIEAEPINA